MWRLGLADIIKSVWIWVGGCHRTGRGLEILTVGERENLSNGFSNF